MSKVLVAVPHRVTTPQFFIDKTKEHFAGFTYPDKELVLMPNELPADGRKYGCNADARNMLIDKHLRPKHDYVLWLDVDLVSVPRDLIEQLLSVSTEGIVAPFVFVEKTSPHAMPDFNSGGWFYDVGGFKRNGMFADAWPPYFSQMNGNVMEMESVGCCYIVPAYLYHPYGLRYAPKGNEVEHLSFCDAARAIGVQIFANPALKVEHAFLPKYGEAWHG